MLNEISDPQEMRELNFNVQSLQKKHYVFNIQDLLVIVPLDIALLVVDNHLKLKHLCILTCKYGRVAPLVSLLSLSIALVNYLKGYGVVLNVVEDVSRFKEDWIDWVVLSLVVNLEIPDAESNVLLEFCLCDVCEQLAYEYCHQLGLFVDK